MSVLEGSRGSASADEALLGGSPTALDCLHAGDVLLLEGYPRSISEMLAAPHDFTLVTVVPGSRPPRTGTQMDTVRMRMGETCK